MTPLEKTGRAFVAGALGGTVKTFCTLPLDVIKTTQQVSTNPRTVLGQARHLQSTRGWSIFYVGTSVALTQQIGKVGIQFAAFQSWNALIPSTFFAGALAGITEACLWTTPSERIKIIQQAELAKTSTQRRQFVGSGAAIRAIFRQQGAAGFFRGVVPTAARQGSSLSVRFFTYSEAKMYLQRQDKKQQSRLWHAPLSGALCGITSAALNQPIDVVKTKMMTFESGAAGIGTIKTFLDLLKQENVFALWKGLPARGLKIGVGQTIVFGVYGNIQQMLGAPRKN